jgi:hypothetical protein
VAWKVAPLVRLKIVSAPAEVAMLLNRFCVLAFVSKIGPKLVARP